MSHTTVEVLDQKFADHVQDSAMKHANHLAEVIGMGIYANHQELF